MESNKFDKQIKEKLDRRIIEPSEAVWDKLSDRLDTQIEKTGSKNYWWLGLAASLVGVLLLVTQFGTVDSNVVTEPSEVVLSPENGLNLDGDKQHNLSETKNDIQQVVTSDKYDNIEKTDFKESLNNKNSDKVAAEVMPKKMTTPEKEKGISETEPSDEKLTFEELKIQDVVAQVHQLKDENSEVTEEDIDALLMKAQNEIALNRLSREIEGQVDANALLESVEQELDQSFRSKVLQAIKASYNSVKTTIAQRNK